MKKILFILTAISISIFSANAQDVNDAQKAAAEAAAAFASAPKAEVVTPKPNYWKTSLMTNLNFLQTSYTNWAKGGNNNFSMDTYIDGNANYKKDGLYWNNRLQLDYGFLYSKDKPIIQKNKDRMLYESTLGHKLTNTLNYTAKLIFMSQFTNGYKYAAPKDPKDPENATTQEWKDARVLKSGFLSPADITLGLGMDWVPNKWLKVNFAPVTGGLKIVNEEALRKNYGMKRKNKYEDVKLNPDKKDDKGLLTNGYMYKGVRVQFGALMTADASMKINDNFTASTQLILFSDYLNHPQNIRVNWTNRFMWKLAKYFTLNLQTDLIYDDNVMIVSDKYKNGHKAIQFLESVKFGFTYTFASKK